MPTASQGAVPAAHKGRSNTSPAARPPAGPLPPAARRNDYTRKSSSRKGNGGRGARSASTAAELVPVRHDSSIGATSTNPRLRHGSVIEAAAHHRSSSAPRSNADFHSPEGKAALRKLRLLFLPVLLRVVLQRRRRARWKHGEPSRRYTADSVVSAIASSKTMLSEWPLSVLEQLSENATFHYLGPKEFIVYAHESHVSCGIVVLLYGQVEERRPDSATKQKSTTTADSATASSTSSRPIRTQTHRLHRATDVLCVMPVLCEDRSTSSFSTREKEEADVAVISSRWFWEVYYNVVQSSLPASEVLTRYMKDVVALHRRDIVMADYFPTSVVLLRSWMWPLLTPSDRVKLCRAMEVRVLGVGEVLYDEGEYCPYIYFVRRGALTVIVKGEVLTVLEAGACLGEESVLFHEKRNSSVVGSTMCELYALHARHLEHRLTKYPEVGQRLVSAAIQRQKQWMEEGKTRDVFGLISILSGVPCLAHSTDTMREELAQCATVRIVPQGHVLATANTPCTSLFVIGRGSLALLSVKPAAPVAPPANDGGRPGSSTRRSASLLPKQRPSSTTKGSNSRVSLPNASPLSPRDVLALPEVRREVRSTGDFLGELCLKPHLWPLDVVCETTVDVWQFDREAILRVLEKNRADAQAIEVCRQGISLYRAQRGETSLIEGFDAPATPPAANGRLTSGTTRCGSRAPSSQAPSQRRMSSAMGSAASRMSMSVSHLSKTDDSGMLILPAQFTDSSAKGRSPRSFAIATEWTPEQWTEYALTRLQKGLAQETANSDGNSAAAASRELRNVDKDVEKALKEKVLRLIAVQPNTPPNPADSDINADGDELQAIIVEQLFLVPTERQPRFIRQINDSNVRLVTDNDEPLPTTPSDLPLEEDELRDPLQSGETPISVGGVMQLEDVNAAAEDSQKILATYPFQGTGDPTDSVAAIRSIGENMELSGQVGLPPMFGRSRRSLSVAALEDSGTGFMASFPAAHNSISRSHLIRPPSGMPMSPRSNLRGELISPRGTSAMRPGSSSEPRLPLPNRVRPTSVDYNQFNKVGVDRSTSVLDRYVKIEDQNYFDDFVKVLPLQQDEIWGTDEVVVDQEEIQTGSLVLLLLHVRSCNYLGPGVMQRCQRPIVKVTLGQRVLVRTSVMHDVVAPHWSIEEASFITLVQRNTEIIFTVCDADDEFNMVYRCTLPTAKMQEDGGVGQQVMTLTELTSTGSEAVIEGSATSFNAESRKKPCLTTTMLAVTASKYKALRQALKLHGDKSQRGYPNVSTVPDMAATASTTTLFLQVMAVEGLKHRIEGSVTVSLYNGGTLLQLLETNQVLPKTRSPAWSADKAFLKVCAEGGVLTFDLKHRGTVISSAEATVDELVFGGVGLRRLPLLQAQTGNAVMGRLVVSVLGANVASGTESHSRDWVTHVAVEALRLSKEQFAISPDPFVILRDGTQRERMRTPLACGTFEVAWPMEEASCFLHCPRLSGSTATYHVEVCDSDAQEVVGRAKITVTERGLAEGPRREIALDPPGSGWVRVRSLCLPVLELPDKTMRASLNGGSTSPVGHPVSPTYALPADAAMVLVHVSGCDDLPRGVTEELQTDAVGTLTIDGRQFLRTPIREGTVAPRWPFSKASVLLHVPSLDVEALQDGASHECRFAVYDGVVDDINHIGQVAVPFTQLLRSATHTYPLFTKAKKKVDGKESGFDASTLQLPSPTNGSCGLALERTAGKMHIMTLCGRLGQQVESSGVEETKLAVDMQDFPANCGTPLALVPYYNPEDATSLFSSCASVTSRSTLSGTVLLGISNVCHVLPNASAKYIHAIVRQGPTPVLSVEAQIGVASHAEWNLAETSAALSKATLIEDTTLSVELHAMNIVESNGEESEAGNAAAAAGGNSATNGTKAPRQQARVSGERILIGKAALPTTKILSVGVGEVDVIALQLDGAPSTRPQSGAMTSASIEEKPTISFSIVGNRS